MVKSRDGRRGITGHFPYDLNQRESGDKANIVPTSDHGEGLRGSRRAAAFDFPLHRADLVPLILNRRTAHVEEDARMLRLRLSGIATRRAVRSRSGKSDGVQFVGRSGESLGFYSETILSVCAPEAHERVR